MIDEIRSFIRNEAERFGAKYSKEIDKLYVERNNTSEESLRDNGAYFGFIHQDEEATGPFHDFSLTIFPSNGTEPWLVCLGIGSNGFKNDYNLASYPGLKRLFSQLIDENGYCKSNFADIESNLPSTFTSRDDLQHIKKTIKQYSKYLPVIQIIKDPASEESKKIISSFVAAYAKIRDWASNKEQRNAISEALNPFLSVKVTDHLSEVTHLLEYRKYVVLQGPPGTGKTRLTKEISNKLNAKVFFIQFHAETTYSDFVYGIKPNLENGDVKYLGYSGTLINSIEYAKNNPKEKVLLIIDEINRANLSNVLGPVFYLFEHKQDLNNINIQLSPELSITNIPENLFVIATMNTADRSLAVVDFALRRRFAWYDLYPSPIKHKDFFKEDFVEFKRIFEWYASADELSLQPGQGYFIADDDEQMRNRVQYELLPLVQEYLREGLLVNAKEDFNKYFLSRINKSISQ